MQTGLSKFAKKIAPPWGRGYLLYSIPAIALGLRFCCREDLATNNARFEGGDDLFCRPRLEVCKDCIVYSLTLSLGSIRVKTSLRYWERSKYTQCNKHWESFPITSKEKLIFCSTLRGENSLEVALVIKDNQLKLVILYKPNNGPLINILNTSVRIFKCSNFCHNNCGPAP